jgi:hypothetical protein
MGAFWVAMLVALLVMLPFTGTAAWFTRNPDPPPPVDGLPLIAFSCVCMTAVLACVFYLLHYHDFDGFTADGNEATSHWLGVANYLKAHEDYDETPAAGVTIWTATSPRASPSAPTRSRPRRSICVPAAMRSRGRATAGSGAGSPCAIQVPFNHLVRPPG